METTQNYVGDFTSIKVSLDGILQKLNKTMSQILESSEQVADHSEQMATAAQDLGQGSVQQSGSVEELESTIKDVSLHVEETAERARLQQQQSLFLLCLPGQLLQQRSGPECLSGMQYLLWS